VPVAIVAYTNPSSAPRRELREGIFCLPLTTSVVAPGRKPP
jgi:hypothetical protein